MVTAEPDDHGNDERITFMTATIDHNGVDIDDESHDVTDAAAAPEAGADEPAEIEAEAAGEAKSARRRTNWARVVVYGLLPALALIVFAVGGYLRWHTDTLRAVQQARTESAQAAKDGTVALLSYTPADVDEKLVAARSLLTGDFLNAYTSLTNDVVIPGAKQQKITAVAAVPAATSVSATTNHAVALVFVNQTTTIGTSAPTDMASTVRIELDKVDGRWLISKFDPV
jgi:Mce-associated membrane protein